MTQSPTKPKPKPKPSQPPSPPTVAQVQGMQRAITDRLDKDATVAFIASALGETEPTPLYQLHRVVDVLGPRRALNFLRKAQEVEAAGGLMTVSGKRRRSPGGVYFWLIKSTVPEAHKCFAWQKKAVVKPAEEAQADFPWKDRIKVLDTIGMQKGITGAMRITVIGKPGAVVTRGSCVITTMKNRKAPELPKGLPTPPTFPTTYVCYITRKQWESVCATLEDDPEDLLIVDGWPTLDPETSSIAVFASRTTTRKMQQAQRQAQQQAAVAH